MQIINIVPQQEAWVVERFGRFLKVLSPGLEILFPFVDQIKYVHSLKEVVVNIAEQTAITNDNVTLTIDGVLFYQVLDPFKASYEIENPDYAIKQLAQTTMRSEIGKLILDDVFKERDTLNKKIVGTFSIHSYLDSIRSAVRKWGIECLREAAINKATGEAQALKINAESRSMAIKTIADAMSQHNSKQAVSYAIAEKPQPNNQVNPSSEINTQSIDHGVEQINLTPPLPSRCKS
ncbi:hypothetical protein HZS_6216, partial [Henneguya salminicola]